MVVDMETLRERFPRHVGIIMDGNGRWASRRGLPRVAGHRAGGITVRRITEAAARLGVQQLTLYAFSTENWKRPANEIGFLMRLFRAHLRTEQKQLLENDVRLLVVGRTDSLPLKVRAMLEKVVEATRHCAGMTLCLALNYGGRMEIVDACRRIVEEAARGEIRPSELDEATIERLSYQPDMPALDLIIRTGGEFRLSNFLLWQSAYAELWFTEKNWPDFAEHDLLDAFITYAARKRRFGGLCAMEKTDTDQPYAGEAILSAAKRL